MNIEKKARKIEKHYKCRGVPLKLVKYEIIENGERIIYTIKFIAKIRDSLNSKSELQQFLQSAWQCEFLAVGFYGRFDQ